MDSHVIQNQDINIGPKAFKNYANDELLVTSAFYTIQGEGPYAGNPAVFVRLAGCNRGHKTDMGCRFCDTAFQFAKGQRMSFSALQQNMLATMLGERQRSNKPLVVITGGEPMMQANVATFCHFLKLGGWPKVQIESNGDRLAPGLPGTEYCKLVVSPKASKVAGSTDQYEYKLSDGVLARADYLKFLIEDDPTSPYFAAPEWAVERNARTPVYLSPITHYARPLNEGEVASAWNQRLIDVPRTRANYARAAELALAYGFRLSMQQHLFFVVA